MQARVAGRAKVKAAGLVRAAARSNPHHPVQLWHGHASVEESELAGGLYLVCGLDQSGHCRAIK